MYDGERVLSRLRIPYIQKEGYVNLRCDWVVGCPAEIEPHIEANASWPANDPTNSGAIAGSFFLEAFEELFPGVYVPESVGAPCCAQFAVTKEMIRMRPRSEYERYRTWLTTTYLGDQLSGRLLEYMWHSKWGPAILRPSQLTSLCSHVWPASGFMPSDTGVLLQAVRHLRKRGLCSGGRMLILHLPQVFDSSKRLA